MPIEYKISGKDTGINNADAVQPIENGEAANESTFQRPSENLRTRTEAIRKAIDDLTLTALSDRSLNVVCEPDTKIVWNSTAGGKFVLNTTGVYGDGNTRDLKIAPFMSKAFAASDVADPAVYQYSKNSGTEKFHVTSNSGLHAYDGANNLFFEMITGAAGPPEVKVTVSPTGAVLGDAANGPITIQVKIQAGASTLDDVVAKLKEGGSPALPFIDTTTTIVDAGETAVALAIARSRFANGTGSEVGSKTAIDNEGHKIAAGELTTFFSTNSIADGQTLYLNYLNARDRLSNTTGSTMTDMLILSNGDTRNVEEAGIIPICKRIGTNLHFMNGKVFANGVEDYLTPSGLWRGTTDLAATSGETLVGTATKTQAQGATFGLVAGTVRTQFQSILDQLAKNDAATFGASHIGAGAKAGTPRALSVGDVEAQITSLLGNYNNHTGGTDPHTWTTITAHPFKTVGYTGSDYGTATPANIKAAMLAAGTSYNVLVTKDECTGYIEIGSTDNFPPRIIGDGGGAGFINSTAGKAVLKIDCATNTVFENVDFNQTATGGPCVNITATADPEKWIEFRNCRFIMGVNDGHPWVKSTFNVRFVNCSFTSGINDSAGGVQMLNTAGAGTDPSLEFHGCTFTSMTKIAYFTGANPINSFIMERCYATTSRTVVTGSSLIDSSAMSGAAISNVRISNNIYNASAMSGIYPMFLHGSTSGSDNYGCFICGEIANNLILYAGTESGGTLSGESLINVYGGGSDISFSRLSVNSNTVIGFGCNCIKAGNCEVRGNSIMRAATVDTTFLAYGIEISDGGVVSGNLIVLGIPARQNNVYGIFTSAWKTTQTTNFAISDNRINMSSNLTTLTGSSVGGIVIRTTTVPTSIIGNSITLGATGEPIYKTYGIATAYIGTVISNNRMNNVKYGVHLGGVVHFTGAATANSGSSVTGNIIFGHPASTDTDCSLITTSVTMSLCNIASNSLFYGYNGIQILGASVNNSIVGNNINGARNFGIRFTEDTYELFSSNIIRDSFSGDIHFDSTQTKIGIGITSGSLDWQHNVWTTDNVP